MPEEHFETAVSAAKEAAGQVTTAFMLREAKRNDPKPEPKPATHTETPKLIVEDKLRERSVPKVPGWAQIYVKAWSDLEHDRSLGHGGGMTRIHYASISQYGRDMGLSGSALQRLALFVRELDEEYLSFVSEQIKKAQEAAKNP